MRVLHVRVYACVCVHVRVYVCVCVCMCACAYADTAMHRTQADSLDGKFIFQNVVQVPWSHNPLVTREPGTGDYLIAHIGCGNSIHVNPPQNCSQQQHQPSHQPSQAETGMGAGAGAGAGAASASMVRVNDLMPPCGCPEHPPHPVACQTLQILRSPNASGPFVDKTVRGLWEVAL